MKTVFKYPIPRRLQKFSMLLPNNFKFLRVHFQEEKLCFWAEVDKDSPKTEYAFAIYGTGQDIPASAVYLTTYDDGPFVFHLYMV